ncbi:MAG: translation initiation factor IF-2 [Flavobacteriaceae bacterium]|nr:translation initiation factor IF-2 [Flavobacteriaceae bacterium]
MSESKTIRLNKVLKELNISLDRAVEYLTSKGHAEELRPTSKISAEMNQVLQGGFQTDKKKKAASEEAAEEKKKEKQAILDIQEKERKVKQAKQKAEDLKKAEVMKAKAAKLQVKTVGKIDLSDKKKAPVSEKKKETVEKPESVKVETKKDEPKPSKVEDKKVSVKKTETDKSKEVTPVPTSKKMPSKAIDQANDFVSKKAPSKNVVKKEEPAKTEESAKLETQYKKLDGPKLTGTIIDLKKFEKPKKKPVVNAANKKRRKRIDTAKSKPGTAAAATDKKRPVFNKKNNYKARMQRAAVVKKVEPTEAEVQKKIKDTLEKLQGKKGKGKGAKYRKEKRDFHRDKTEKQEELKDIEKKTLKLTEFVTASELAAMMDVPVTGIISTCMSLGLMVTMNQRLDAETLSIVADEFNFKTEFINADVEEAILEEKDEESDLVYRAPIVTVMGHVDHGKTSLLDYIRKANVTSGESGGITQHIGSYSVDVNGKKITFLDTPGHEAFTAMRARGAQVTDLTIIVIAADDSIMPQTKEAISHAQAAGVPMIFAINKIDKEGANPETVKQQLASMDLLVEDWGGKYQSQEISAKKGLGIEELLEKVVLESEMLDLKANPNKRAVGTVVEASLDKGRGYVSSILVQSGTLKVGDYMLAGKNSGKIKAMFNESGKKMKEAGPSTPVSVLGLDGAPQAGDKFHIFEDEKEAKQIATKRSQLQREQSVRTQKHITLDEIGRRIALGDFKEINIILKGDVDGSVEALTDSFQKLSTEEIQVNIVHRAVGAITESDVLLASASNAIIIGFNVRPAGAAKTLADTEEVDVRTYSIIYDAINDLKDAMEGMLSPDIKEEVTGNVEIREIFKISKVGNIAGCMVMNGKIFRSSLIRIIREGIVVHTGELIALKRFKDDVKEVSKGYDCGVQIKGYNDIQEGDNIEAYQEIEVKKKLK